MPQSRTASARHQAEAIYDRNGNAVAFLRGGRIVSLSGGSIAWLDSSGNVYDYRGEHLGWWHQGHMRGHDGGIVGWVRGAKGLGLFPPAPKQVPPLPPPGEEPTRPLPNAAPLRPVHDKGWSATSLADLPALWPLR